MKSPQIVNQLKSCGISGKVWIDAGCGNGTFTFPLASMVSKIIALDTNKHNLSYLESRISSEMDIQTKLFDFNIPSWYENPVDGILFGFSLHDNPNHKKVLENAYFQLKEKGKLVVFEYSSDKSVFWVPHPLPLNRLIPILDNLAFQDIQVVENFPAYRTSRDWNNASYSLVATK